MMNFACDLCKNLNLVSHSKVKVWPTAELLPHAEASEALLRKVRSDWFRLAVERPKTLKSALPRFPMFKKR
jgi:hypothetical protein